MKVSEIKCIKCHENAMQASKRGAYLERISPKGIKPMLMECRPVCGRDHGGQEVALLNAIKGT